MAEIKKNTDDNKILKISMTDGVLVPEKDESSIFSAWRISFFGAIIIMLLLFFVSESNIRRVKLFFSYKFSSDFKFNSYDSIDGDFFENKILPSIYSDRLKLEIDSFYLSDSSGRRMLRSDIDGKDKARVIDAVLTGKKYYSFVEIPAFIFNERIIRRIKSSEEKEKFASFYEFDEYSKLYVIKEDIEKKDLYFLFNAAYKHYFINPYAEAMMFIPDGIRTTFFVTVLAIFFASIIGLFVGLGRISRITFINRAATIYVEIIRGIPLLVQLFYIYYALAKLVNIEGIASAVIAMSVCYGAYIGEIFRAGIQSIPKGQMEAALALGMTRGQAIVRIILPQTFKVVLPPIGNEFIALLKDSSLVSILAVSDLLRRGREYAAKTFYYFETYTVIALVYLILTLFFSRIVGIMEEQLKKRGG